MVIGVCGYGFSGSGACTDLLKEYADATVIDDVEFKLTYMQDGIETLHFHLIDHPIRFYDSDVAIRRFKRLAAYLAKSYDPLTDGTFSQLIDTYLNSLIQVTWKGTASFHRIDVSAFERFFSYSIMENLRKVLYKHGKIWQSFPDKPMYLSLQPESFMKDSRDLVENLINAMRKDKKGLMILNQAFPADRPELSFPYFSDPKAICISRDPRDLFILAKHVVKHKARFIPTDSVEDFIRYYRAIMENASTPAEYESQILRISFESMIYEYEKTVHKIEQFTGLTQHTLPLTYFNPEISKRNTNLIASFPQYKTDIKKIEDNLALWLYPFELNDSKMNALGGSIF